MLTKDQEELYDYIDDLFHYAYCQHADDGWSLNLWKYLQENKDATIGHLEFNLEVRIKLNLLIKKCGGWIRFDEENDEYFVTLEEWNNYLKS